MKDWEVDSEVNLWAIVPVKALSRGKSRLAGVLSQDERALLNYAMLENTLKVLANVKSISKILVTSRDPSALSLARENGARTVQEDGNSDLNMALRRATIVARTYAVHGVIIIPADLPLISADDVEQLIHRSGNPPEVIIVPDRKLGGTNALLMNPGGVIDYCFGLDSFQRHLKQAKQNGIRVEICSLSSLEFDIDLPEDLETLKQLESKSKVAKDLLLKSNFFRKTNHILEAK